MVLSFGLRNAPATFRWLINSVSHQYLDKFIIVFLNDILIYSNSEEEHQEHFRMVLQLLKEHKLYAKLSKCEFCQEHVHYLGHVISIEGIFVDPQKNKAIMEWLAPRNICEIRSFMGLAGYYRQDVKGFSIIADYYTAEEGRNV